MSLVKYQLRRGTAAEWAACDPILAEGELGLNLDTLQIKVGNGQLRWLQLDYINQDSNSPLNNLDVTNVVDGSLIYYDMANGIWKVDADVTVKEIVNGGNF